MRVRGRRGACCAASTFAIGRGESYGLVGESGCGKSTVGLRGCALSAAQRLGQRRAHPGRRPGPAGRSTATELRELRRQDAGDGLSGSRPGAQSVDPHRPPGRGGLRARRASAATSAPRRAADMLKRVRISRSGAGDAALSAPAVGRHAAARRHRHGAGQQSGAADPRRADDRTRRDGRGRGARPDRAAAARILDLDPVHQPQPGGRRQDVRPGRRALCRHAWSRKDGPSDICSRSAPSLYGRPAALPAAARPQQETTAPLDTIPGFLPSPGARPQGCVFADRCALADRPAATIEPAALRSRAGRPAAAHYHERAATSARTTAVAQWRRAPIARARPPDPAASRT